MLLGSAVEAQPPATPKPQSHVAVITNPDWLRKPTFNDMLAAYPAEAARRGQSGLAVLQCVVQTNGLTRDCKVIKETPPDLGFGSAALVVSHTLLFKPRLEDGRPVEAEITVPINFSAPYGPTGSQKDNTHQPLMNTATAQTDSTAVFGAGVWSKTPTMLEILAEIDKKVGDKFADGLVVLQCKMDHRTGKLNTCQVANASPGMAQFQGVARALAPKFQADVVALGSPKGDALINLAFAFPDMSSPDWSKRYLAHPRWIRTISPDPDKATFPESAAKAGLKTGKATVDCVVGADGALAQCQVVSESTPNLGFGEMAIKIAEAFAANPWNEDGLPVDGAHVRMPIQMDYDPPANTPAGAPTPATTPAASPGSPPPSR
jgi:TonB family protein